MSEIVRKNSFIAYAFACLCVCFGGLNCVSQDIMASSQSDSDADPDSDVVPEPDGDIDFHMGRYLEIGLNPNEPLWNPPEKGVKDVIYINPTNFEDKAQDGSIDHPFDSFDRVTWRDNTIYALRRGTIVEMDSFGIGASGVTVASYGEGDEIETRPIIRSVADGTLGENSHAVWIYNQPNITFRDIEIEAPNATSALRFAGGSSGNVRVINCILRGSMWGLRSFDFSGLSVFNTEIYDIDEDGMFIQGMRDIEISYCSFHDMNVDRESEDVSDLDGDALQLSNVDDFYVHHNLFDQSDNNQYCFISTSNKPASQGVLEYNIFRGPYFRSENSENSASIYIENTRGFIVRYNFIEFSFSLALEAVQSQELQFYGNVVSGCWDGISISESADVLNNTFYSINNDVSGGDIRIINNIFNYAGSGQNAFENVAQLSESHNLFSLDQNSTSSFVGHPRFVDAQARNFHLRPSSDAIDRGTDVGLVEDLDGNAIPYGNAPDIGAYEFLQ